MMNKKNAIFVVTFFLGCLCTINFWVYSRLTVDDAFITWRYGKNLVDAGIWNYNPNFYDLTQAYTNPIIAIISIIPAFIGIDTVFFFKAISILSVVIFCIWYLKESRGSWIPLLIILSIPATVIHAFAGLETFIYVLLVSVLIIELDKNSWGSSILCAVLLFMTRPESWLLVVIMPFYFSIHLKNLAEFKENISIYSKLNILAREFDLSLFFKTFCALALPLGAYLIVHKLYFGYALPNTYYVKSGGVFSMAVFMKFNFFLLPIFLLYFQNKYKLILFLIIFFEGIIYNYSKSILLMDYSSRFIFHVFFPIYISMSIILTKKILPKFFSINFSKLTSKITFNIILIGFLMVFIRGIGVRNIIPITYYPRALDAHASFGKLLKNISHKYAIHTFMLGDAGMAAFHSGINAFDNAGLGSSKAAHNGISEKLLDNYGIDLIAYQSRPDGIRLSDYNQDLVHRWAVSKNFQYICEVYFLDDYTLKLYSRRDIPELYDLCLISKEKNDRPDIEYLRNIIFVPPWQYWRE